MAGSVSKLEETIASTAKASSLSSAPEQRLFLDLVLYPQRSMKPAHFQRFLLVMIGISGLASVRFYLVGAWPVAAFLLLDIVALWLAFAISYRRGRLRETVQLSNTDLIITRTDPAGRLTSWRFEPYWAKVSIDRIQSTKDVLTVYHHDKKVSLGSYLRAKERRQIAGKLNSALSDWHSSPH